MSYEQDVVYLRVARELAMDLYDIQTILKNNKVDPNDFEKIKTDPQFLRVLEAEIAAWHTAGNTHERTKLKAAALIEEWLPEANTRIHDGKESLAPKTELAKLLARIAGMGERQADGVNGGTTGDRFRVTINIGAGKSIKFVKDVTSESNAGLIENTPVSIKREPVETSMTIETEAGDEEGEDE